jgi:diguanylate cyclase (GGDEF)-like protein
MESAGHLVGVLCLVANCEEYTEQEVRLLDCLGDCLAGTFKRLAQGDVTSSRPETTISAGGVLEVAATSTHAVSLRMSYLAQHDALTDLPNRLLLNDRMARSLALSSRYRRPLAVLFLDLDRFKEINDLLGHAIGDQVLRQISDRLVTCVRSSDTVSRIGGDEFVVLLAELECAEDAAFSAGRILAAITAPLHIAGHEVHVAMSIGISIYPDDGDNAEALIKKADSAMYLAKAEGLGKYKFFTTP